MSEGVDYVLLWLSGVLLTGLSFALPGDRFLLAAVGGGCLGAVIGPLIDRW